MSIHRKWTARNCVSVLVIALMVETALAETPQTSPPALTTDGNQPADPGSQGKSPEAPLVWKEKFFVDELPKDVQLQKVRASLCTFQKIDFGGADLVRSSFTQCTINQSNFAKAQLSEASLYGTSFVGANFSGANLVSAEFDICVMSNRTDFSRVIATDSTFHGTVAQGVSFKGADLVRAKFAFATFMRCDFTDANLLDIDFDSAYFQNCQFGGKVNFREGQTIDRLFLGKGNDPAFVKWALKNGGQELSESEWKKLSSKTQT